METQNSSNSILIIIALIVIIAYFFYNKQKKVKQLKQLYDEALNGNDKKAALNAGRLYYAALRRNGKLTVYDEQAINNDLTTMKDL